MLNDQDVLFSCEKSVVNWKQKIRCLQYVVTTSVNIRVSEWFDIHQSVGEENEYKTTTCGGQGSCTYNANGIGVFRKKEYKSSDFKARELEEQTDTAIIAKNTLRKQKGSKLNSFRCHQELYLGDNKSCEDTRSFATAFTQDKKDNKKDNMMRFSEIIDNPCWREREPNDVQNGDWSPQLVKNTADFRTNRSIDSLSNLQGDFDFFPELKMTVDVNEECNENENSNLFLFENVEAVLEQTDKAKASKANNATFFKNSITDSNASIDCNKGKCNLHGKHFYNEIEDNNGYNSSIASSSSSAIYELFDDVSILTNEDSLNDFYDKDNADGKGANTGNFLINLRTFEDMSLLTDDILKGKGQGKNTHAMVCSLSKDDLFQNHYKEEEKNSFEEYILQEGKNICNEFNDRNPLNSYNGFRYEEGFSPDDELRLA